MTWHESRRRGFLEPFGFIAMARDGRNSNPHIAFLWLTTRFLYLGGKTCGLPCLCNDAHTPPRKDPRARTHCRLTPSSEMVGLYYLIQRDTRCNLRCPACV